MSMYTKSHNGNAPTLPSITTLIREGLALAPDSVDWYKDAGDACAAFAADMGYEFLHVVGVLSITSPRVTVKRNVELCTLYLSGDIGETPAGHVSGLLPSTEAALAHWEASGRDNSAIRGDKTRNFALAIAGDESAVVVDVWTVRGMQLTHKTLTSKRYRAAAASLARIGKRAGVSPAAAQAALWYGTRARYGRTGGTSTIRF